MDVKKFLGILLLLLISIASNAQYLKGKLIDEKGNPMPYANVYVKESTYGVSTDGNGNYFLELKPGSYIIVFSFVGAAPPTLPVAASPPPFWKTLLANNLDD